jgi:hypothetical protein
MTAVAPVQLELEVLDVDRGLIATHAALELALSVIPVLQLELAAAQPELETLEVDSQLVVSYAAVALTEWATQQLPLALMLLLQVGSLQLCSH